MVRGEVLNKDLTKRGGIFVHKVVMESLRCYTEVSRLWCSSAPQHQLSFLSQSGTSAKLCDKFGEKIVHQSDGNDVIS